MTSVLAVRSLITGKAHGALLVLSDGLSFWGGLDPASGEIVDSQHPQRGQNVRGKVIVLPSPKGSTAAPGALLECLCAGNGPAAIVLVRPDVTPCRCGIGGRHCSNSIDTDREVTSSL